MVDYNELKKKFKPQRKAAKASTRASVKAIAREYELKKAEIEGRNIVFRKGPLFYGLIILLLLALGSMVVPRLMSGGVVLTQEQVDRNAKVARDSIDALTIALGRYKYDVGSYPTTEEGLAVLAYRMPRDIKRIRRQHPGWDGPYVKKVAKDPWGNDYVYEGAPAEGCPVLFSKGPDAQAGTDDDVKPDTEKFELPTRDTSWRKRWAPAELRGTVVAKDEETKRYVEERMKEYDPPPEPEPSVSEKIGWKEISAIALFGIFCLGLVVCLVRKLRT